MTAVTTLNLVVMAKEPVADQVVALTLAHPERRRLPDWTPGAHIDLILPDGRTRQYSLCGSRWDSSTYRIAVLRDPDGRGGSAYIHDTLAVGDMVAVGGPRNNFALVPSGKYLFIAGGIGITPMLSMLAQADLLGCDWRLAYLGRSRRTMAFTADLAAYGDRVSISPDDECGVSDLGEMLASVEDDTVVFCCGPARLLDAVQRCCADWQPGRLRIERFVPKAQANAVRDTAFDIELRRSRRRVTVAPRQSVLEALRGAGASVLSSCGQGVCGTCETTVLDGLPDHRDSILDDAEREAGDSMFVCVSRSLSDRLVLDL
ncbi:PDR/VanB family oxidoreductase [Nocardia fluminea]|uniref:Ferredoxin-NADP reductase n=1 Tax=Nocardia fluminea TaxID=134984 RepID=A0A2N3V5N2_9NOCA|nr:PDR/VanB family oxidoreductase [Nocardia fluminea]PKV76901.1 ferredoxin-NADP reductase [Nocardia fluminea]